MLATARRNFGWTSAPLVSLRRGLSALDHAPATAFFVLTCAGALVLYSSALTKAFQFDDINVLYQAIVHAPDPLYLITQFDGQTTGGSWRPLLHVVLWLEWHSFGTNAIFYHAVNVLLHAFAAFTLGAIALELSGRRSVARFAGVVFLVQPLPEAIAWIVAGPLNVMSALFYLAGLLFHIRSRRRSRRRSALLSLMFLVLSLASYEVALTYVGAIVAYDVLFHWAEWTPRQRFMRTGTVALIAIAVDLAFVVARASIIGSVVGSYGASAVFGFASIAGRFQTVVRAFWTPANGAMPATSAAAVALPIFQVSLIAALVAVLLLRPSLRPIIFGVAVAVCALVPFAGFISINQDLSSSRYLYLATAGIALSVGVALGGRKLPITAAVATLLVGASAVILTLNLTPWATAGAMVDSTVKAASEGPLQTFGVPVHDLYGAYTFGTASNIPEYPGANGIDVVMDGPVQSGRNLMYWDGSSLVPLDTSPIAGWSATDLRGWSWSSSVGLEPREDGLLVTSSDGDPWGWSPTLSLPSQATHAVVVALDVPQNTCKRAQLIWRFSRAGDAVVYADLEAGLHEYVFVQPTAVVGDTLVGLRFDPLLCPGAVRVLRLEVGGRSQN